MWNARVEGGVVTLDRSTEPIERGDEMICPDLPWVPALVRAASEVAGRPVSILGRPFVRRTGDSTDERWRAALIGEPDAAGRPVLPIVDVDIPVARPDGRARQPE